MTEEDRDCHTSVSPKAARIRTESSLLRDAMVAAGGGKPARDRLNGTRVAMGTAQGPETDRQR